VAPLRLRSSLPGRIPGRRAHLRAAGPRRAGPGDRLGQHGRGQPGTRAGRPAAAVRARHAGILRGLAGPDGAGRVRCQPGAGQPRRRPGLPGRARDRNAGQRGHRGLPDRRRPAARRGQVPPRRGAVVRGGGGRGDRAGLRQPAGAGPGRRRLGGAGVPGAHLRRVESARPGRRRPPDRHSHRRRGHGPHPGPPTSAPGPRPKPGPRPGPARGLSRPRGRRPCRSGR
jgi:hypothetical protein